MSRERGDRGSFSDPRLVSTSTFTLIYLSCSCRTEHSKWMKLPALKWTDRLLIPSHHSTRKLFCCPKSTELTPSAFSPTHHNFSPPSQVGAVISVSGCERQIYQFLPIFNLFFLSFHFLTFKTKFWELQSVFQVSVSEHPSTQLHDQLITQMDTAKGCGVTLI